MALFLDYPLFLHFVYTQLGWYTIDTLREKGRIAKNSLPDDNTLKKGMFKRTCGMCEDDTHTCDCEAELTSNHDFVKDNIQEYITFIPDLYVIDEEGREITAIEVEDTNRVTIIKLVKYATFHDVLDWWFPEWTFNLLICDRFGNRLGHINLPVYYHASLPEDFSDNYMTYLETVERRWPTMDSEITGYYRSAPFA